MDGDSNEEFLEFGSSALLMSEAAVSELHASNTEMSSVTMIYKNAQ